MGNVQVCHTEIIQTHNIYEIQPPPATLIHGFTLFSSCCDYSPALFVSELAHHVLIIFLCIHTQNPFLYLLLFTGCVVFMEQANNLSTP